LIQHPKAVRSATELALWLAELMRPGADPARAQATENGQRLLELALTDGALEMKGDTAAQHFAELLAELDEDGWIRASLELTPGEEAPVGIRDARLLSRYVRIRLTPEGWRAMPSLGAPLSAENLAEVPEAATTEEARDVFISHANEDKDTVARPLAVALQARGWRVWFDEYELTIGDGLRRTIDRGLATSRYGIVILSPQFFAKDWPQRELDGLVARETTSGDKVVLPVWHGVDAKYVAHFSPTLADRLAASSSLGSDGLAEAIEKALFGGGLTKPTDGNAPPPAISLPLIGAPNPVLEAVLTQNAPVLREVLRRELAAYHQGLAAMLDHRFNERPSHEIVGETAHAVLPLVERLATQLLPLVEHDVSLFEQQVRTIARKLRREPFNGYAFWYEVRLWATWWLVHVLGAYATRREAFAALRPLLRIHRETQYTDVTVSLSYNFLDDASAMIGEALAPTGQRWLSPTWEHLAATVRDSAALQAGWPELFEEQEDPRQALAEWSLLQTLGLGLLGEGSVAFWELGRSQSLARRLARDDTLRARLADEAYGLTLQELDEQAPQAFEAVHGFQQGFTSGSDAARIFLGTQNR
jgi:hypothetical protein